MVSLSLEGLEERDLYLIKPLWEKFNNINSMVSRNFGDSYKNILFEDLMRSLTDNPDLELRIEVAKEVGIDKIIGYCLCSINKKNKTGIINSLFVESGFRRKGIGTKLMESAFNWIEKHQVKEYVLSVVYNNQEALNFLQSLNYYPEFLTLSFKG